MATSSQQGGNPSGRDKKKPRISLGPEIKVEQPPAFKSYNLVVCGAVNPQNDGFIFSDFLGFSMALKQKGVGGDFWSCFPLDEHLLHLASLKPPITDIKFGKFGPNHDQALHTYTKFQHTHRERWWKAVGRQVLKDDILAWIAEKARLANSGDVVNIIIESHGSQGGGIRLGEYRLYPPHFAAALRDFKDEVQVNVITGVCYGSLLVKAIRADGQYYRYIQAAEDSGTPAYGMSRSVSGRVRNSRFSQAVCVSLAQMYLQEVHQDQKMSVGQYELSVKDQMMRNITPNFQVTNPSSYHGSPTSLTSHVNTMIFRDSVDVLYDPALTHRRRRIEWPSLNLNLRQTILHSATRAPPSQTTITKTKALLDEEFAKCDVNSPLAADDPAMTYYYYKEHREDYGPLLKLLYWRGRQQSAIFDCFQQLCMRNFVQAGNVSLPMNIVSSTESVLNLASLLACFEGPLQVQDEATKVELDGEEFDLPLRWLATMIVRSSADITRLLENILAMRYLGDLNERAFAEYKEYRLSDTITCDSKAQACKPCRPNQFGFWLPHGIRITSQEEMAEDLLACIAVFNRIEECYQEWFGLAPGDLLTEKEQSTYLDANPDKYPRY